MGGLEPHLIRKIRDAGVLRSYPARSYIFYEGDPATGVLVVDSGLIRIDRARRTGRVMLLDLIMPGGLVGELGVIDDEPRSATMSTVTEAKVYHVPADAFRALMAEDDEIQDAVIKRLTRRLRSLSTQLLESTMDAPHRIAARLLALIDIEETLGRLVVEDNGMIDLRLPISQEELGQWAGLSREGAVKGLKTLRSINVIETGRKRVKIHDRDRLVELAQLD